MEQNTLKLYALALLTLWDSQEGASGDRPPLGWALNRETQRSRYKLAAHRLLLALLEHSPSPEAGVAHHFMTALAQCKNSVVIDLVNVLNSDRSVSPGDWAANVYEELGQNGNLLPLTELAILFLNDLIIPFRDPTADRWWNNTTSSQPNTPDPTNRKNTSLLESATVRHNQAALKELIFRRDSPRCVITGYAFVGKRRSPSYCTHIVPLSVHNKTSVHAAIGMFTGNEVRAEEVQHLIYHPANAVNLHIDSRASMNLELAWGIEVRSVNNDRKYYFRVVRPDDIYATMPLNDGDEMEFGKGEDANTIELPDPRLCNLQLTVARVYAASGFAEVVDEIMNNRDGESGDIDIDDVIWCRLVLNEL